MASGPVRKMAGLLMEFIIPGQRRELIPLQGSRGPIRKGMRFKGNKSFLGFVEKSYNCPDFAAYAKSAALKAPELDLPPVFEVPFDADFGVLHELRVCTAVVDWIHVGNDKTWLARPPHTKAATQWIRADDEARRRAFTETAAARDEPLAAAVVYALGQEFEMRIRKRVERIGWLCAQADKREETMGQQLNLGHDESTYLLNLFDIEQVSLSEKEANRRKNLPAKRERRRAKMRKINGESDGSIAAKYRALDDDYYDDDPWDLT
ncbi:hypothetical protein M885DRAFT_516072 [Pelagophyceae sp. CCMP2097]|nr:hypothetical protein M885DRAFT_516072 [Pelagophyceae sp. CCMP2097]